MLAAGRLKMAVVVLVGLACLASFAACDRLRNRLNEQSAQLSIKAIRSAERAFVSGNGNYGTLQELAARGLVESKLASGMNDGYRFDLSVNGKSYKATAVPITYEKTGSWSFYVNETGIVRGTSLNRPANANDQPVRYQE